MHKGVILLTKADTVSEAQNNVENFLESYGESRVWDWYVIGGRWSGSLNKLHKQFSELAEERVPGDMGEFGRSSKNVEENSGQWETIWEEIGGEGEHPFNRDSYKSAEYTDDIIPLKNCIDIVKEWEIDRYAKGDEEYKAMVKAYTEKPNPKHPNSHKSTAAYHANIFHNFIWDSFSFDSNTYDVEEWTNDVPEKDIEKYWAVMIDMHN